MQRSNDRLAALARQLFQEPRRGPFHVVLVLIGLFNLAYGLVVAGTLGLSLQVVIVGLGVWIFLAGVAELLPRNRRLVAGWLRIVSYAALVSAMIVALFDLLV